MDCAVQDIQSTMLRQLSTVVKDEISEMPDPDVISQSPRQSQLKYSLLCVVMLALLLVVIVLYVF